MGKWKNMLIFWNNFMQIIRKYLSGFPSMVWMLTRHFIQILQKQKITARNFSVVSMKQCIRYLTAALIYGVRLYGICLTLEAVCEMKAELKEKIVRVLLLMTENCVKTPFIFIRHNGQRNRLYILTLAVMNREQKKPSRYGFIPI